MAELVDAHDSKSCVLGHVGSIPTLGTEKGFFGSLFYFHIFSKNHASHLSKNLVQHLSKNLASHLPQDLVQHLSQNP